MPTASPAATTTGNHSPPHIRLNVLTLPSYYKSRLSLTPRPCVSLRRHGQIDVSLERLIQLGTIDPTMAAFLAAAVKSRCNIIVTGGVNAGKMALPHSVTSQRIQVRRSGIFVAEAHTVTKQVGITRAEPRPVAIDLGDSPRP
jgi:Flp pilus assembly CpaF family ATPase